MRRLVPALLVAAAAALLTPGAAYADPGPGPSPAPCYGVDADTTHAGVCGPVSCTDMCFITVDPYCYHDSRAQVPDACTIVDRIKI